MLSCHASKISVVLIDFVSCSWRWKFLQFWSLSTIMLLWHSFLIIIIISLTCVVYFICAAGFGCDIEEELSKYLSDSSADLNSLDRYPNIRKLFITLNTGLPASAAVERLFSLGGRVFSLLRAKLSSEHFEMMLFYAVQISESWRGENTLLTVNSSNCNGSTLTDICISLLSLTILLSISAITRY